MHKVYCYIDVIDPDGFMRLRDGTLLAIVKEKPLHAYSCEIRESRIVGFVQFVCV